MSVLMNFVHHALEEMFGGMRVQQYPEPIGVDQMAGEIIVMRVSRG